MINKKILYALIAAWWIGFAAWAVWTNHKTGIFSDNNDVEIKQAQDQDSLIYFYDSQGNGHVRNMVTRLKYGTMAKFMFRMNMIIILIMQFSVC
jgi:hypothetical protein